MNVRQFVEERVAKYYWKDDINCAETTLKILSEYFNTPVNAEVFHSCFALPGAGQCGGLCGLVSGTIMFMGICGNRYKIRPSVTSEFCTKYTVEFRGNFTSVQCNILRPEGFHPDNPPHICEALTCDSIEFSIGFVSKYINK